MSTIASKYSGTFFSSRKRSTTGSIGDDQESRTAGEVGNEENGGAPMARTGVTAASSRRQEPGA
jgi:hypothetical protein